MAVSANLFVTDSLVGSTQVKNTFANISVATRPLAFIGDQSFVVKLRRNSTEGDVIATTPQITIRDNAALVSFVANTYTVAEGDLVEFTLTTTGAANNAVLYYSTFDATPNVDVQDFFGSNVGSFTLVDNVGTIVLRANTDGSVVDETGETFKLQIRTGSVTGNVVLVSDNVAILDTSNTSSYFISQTTTSIVEGSNVTFSISSVNVPDGTEVFYTTAGNVRSYNFTTGNTGSRIIVNGSNTIDLIPASIPNNETRQFALQLREGSSSGQIKATSQNVSVSDTALLNLNATGGTIVDSGGYRTHIFTSTSNLSITSALTLTSVEYLVVGGGAGGGGTVRADIGPPFGLVNNFGGGGGAGGLRTGNVLLSQANVNTYTVNVGAGGTSNVNGGSSTFLDITSFGGGSHGKPGGSGGGAYWFGGGPVSAGAGSPGQGNPGGSVLFGNSQPPVNVPGNTSAAGGGGAGAAGGNAPYASPSGTGSIDRGASGGNGLPIAWIPSSYGTTGPTPGRWFAGGGAGGGYTNPPFPNPAPGTSGGAGGGGSDFGIGTPIPALAGTVNTGGGGATKYRNASEVFDGGTGGSGIVIIRYPFTAPSTFALTEDKTNVQLNQNITFSVITTNVANNYVLYYNTSGNVISTDFVQGNTGSFAVVNNAANITLTANAALAALAQGEERVFNLRVLEGAVDGDIILVSNTITVTLITPPVSATGGTVIDDGGYRIHTFGSSSNLVVSQGGQVEYLVVAGGGGGGSYGAGGGGGVRQGSLSVTSNENYTILVGSGGGGGKGYVGQPAPGVIFSTSGQNSEFSTITSHGGGYGGIESQAGSPGGSGGSAGASGAAGVGNDPPFSPPQGFPGGAGLPAPTFDYFSGGGGGASQAGANATPTISGKGGDGAPSLITNANVIYGGGGGGGSFPHGSIGPAPGGAGGGGAGANPSPTGAGGANTGGGGGGGKQYLNPGGAGGGGIVIIRYPIA